MRIPVYLLVLGFGTGLLSAAALADDTGFAYSHDLHKEGGKTCMVDHIHQGSGEGATKPAAQAAAVRSWVDFTNFEYGSDWARWSKAVGKTTSYTKAESGWSATIEARACK